MFLKERAAQLNKWKTAKVEKILDKIAAPRTKEEREQREQAKPLIPIIGYDLLPGLEQILNDPNENLGVGSVVAAGHMPNGFSEEMLRDAGIVRNDEGFVEHITRKQIKKLHELKKEAEKQPGSKVKDGPFRFIDTIRNIKRQENKLYKKLDKLYKKQKDQGATRVFFSVCAISAGFDLNYSNALLRLMEEKGAENFVFSIFLPFSKRAVTEYSVSGQGVNPRYWVDQWSKLQQKAAEYPNSIFIHEPKLLEPPADKKDQVHPASIDNVDSIHKRGKDINKDQNSVYSDVNRQLVIQALRAVKWNVKKVRGIFAEAFQKSNALLGGGPEIMAMLLWAGVPIWNLDFVRRGLTEKKYFGRARMLEKYFIKGFRPLMKDSDQNEEINAKWGPDNMPLRRKVN